MLATTNMATPNEHSNGLDVDRVLDKIGSFGRYQRVIVFTVCFVAFSTAFNNLGYVFWAARVNHHCIPSKPLQSLNLSDEQLLNLTIPWEESNEDGSAQRSRCHAFDLAQVEDQLNYGDFPMTMFNSSNLKVKDCQRWRYDLSQYKSTIVTEWDLVCSRKWLTSTTQSVYMAGRILGTLVFGHFSDRYGRRKALLVAVSLQVVCSVGGALVNNIYIFLVLRFLLGIQTTGEFQSAYVIVTELVGPSWRVLTGTILQLYWAAGYMSLAGIAYCIRDRFVLQLVLSVPLVCLTALYWIVPETPRWLLANGREEECVALLKKISVTNRTEYDNTWQLRHTCNKGASSGSNITHLFRTPNIRRTSLILLFVWFVNSFVFYGLSLSSSSLGGNDYFNFFISGLVEVPANLACLASFTRFGRPRPFAVAMILAGLSLMFTLAVPPALSPVRVSLVMLGKAAITCSYAMVYLYTSEVYPTVIRGIGVGAGAMMARIGGVIAPLAADLGLTGLPAILFGVLSLFAGVFVVFLPETRDRPLCQTIEEGELMCGRDSRKCCSRRSFQKRNNHVTSATI